MSENNQWSRFAISFNNSDHTKLLFAGPRTVIQRLVTATATEGVILPITPPNINSSYVIDIEGPAVRCQPAGTDEEDVIRRIRDRAVLPLDPTRSLRHNRYYGFVPSFPQNDIKNMNAVQALDNKRLQEPVDGSNQLWMVYSNYLTSDEEKDARDRVKQDIFTTCSLYRAAYKLNMTFASANVQNVTVLQQTILEEVAYPTRDELQVADGVYRKHAYSAVMWAISDLLIGKMSSFWSSNATNHQEDDPWVSQISTQIAHTALLGSSDLRAFFDENRIRQANASDQTKEDIRFAGNGRSLPALIEELAFNATVSFMNSPLLSPIIQVPTIHTQSIITYDYSARTLVLVYGLAVFFALVANLAGLYAMHINGASHARTFSARFILLRGAKLMESIEHTLGMRGLHMPLAKEILRMKIRFDVGLWSFLKVGPGQDGDEVEEGGERQRSWWKHWSQDKGKDRHVGLSDENLANRHEMRNLSHQRV